MPKNCYQSDVPLSDPLVLYCLGKDACKNKESVGEFEREAVHEVAATTLLLRPFRQQQQ